jgi:flagellar biosynthesis protein FliQ
MDVALIVDWSQQAIRVALVLGGIPLLVALGVGLMVGALQTLTQVNEPVVGLVPRLVAVLLAVLVALPWLVRTWVAFAVELIGSLPDRLG